MMINDALSRRSRMLFGMFGAGLLVAGGVVTYAAAAPDPPGEAAFTATFARAGQLLDERSEVKIRGIAVGKVDSVRLDERGRAVVAFHVDDGIRLPRTTEAHAEPLSVFGPKDLVLQLGAGEGDGPYLEYGDAVPKTHDPQELADVAWPAYRLTRAIDPENLATVLHTFSTGLDGQGPALRRTVTNSGKLADLAYARRPELSGLISNVDALSGEFQNRGGTITGLARDFNAVSRTAAADPDRLGDLLDQTGTLAGRIGDTLNEHGDATGRMVDGAAATVDVVYEQRRNIPLLMDGLIGFFAGTASTIRIDGPSGTKLAAVIVYLPLDVCTALQDICFLPGMKELNDNVVKKAKIPDELRSYIEGSDE